MTLVEFVNQPMYLERDEEGAFMSDDELLLIDARGLETTRLWRIQGQVRKTQVETAVIMNDTLTRLKALGEDDLESAQVRQIAKATHYALSRLYAYEFYINLNDPTVANMFEAGKALGVLNADESAAITEAATYHEKPFENTTIEEIRAIRYPSSWKPVVIANGNSQIVTPEGDLVNASNTGAFRFVLTTLKAFVGKVEIRIYAKKAGETVFAVQDSFPLVISKSWESNTAYAHVLTRPLGLSGYRHFKFEIRAPFEGAFSTVTVEGVN